MSALSFKTGDGKDVRVIHGGLRSSAYCFYPGSRLLFSGTVGVHVPKTWAEWNVLPSWTLTHEGDAADRRWAEVSS